MVPKLYIGMNATGLILIPFLAIGFFLALALIILVLVGEVKRIGYREIPLETGIDDEELLSKLERELAARGKYALREPGGLLLDGMVRIRVRLIRGASNKSIAFWAEPKDWFLALEVVLLVIAFYIALILGLVAYIRYDDDLKILKSALTAIVPRDNWYYLGF